MKQTAVTGMVLPWIAGSTTVSAQPAVTTTNAASGHATAALRWLEGAPVTLVGATLGVSWPRSVHASDARFRCVNDAGVSMAVQTWPLARWPDGSLKWTGHALGPEIATAASLRLEAGEAAEPAQPLVVHETADVIEFDTGVIRCRIGRAGRDLIESIERNGAVIAQRGQLIGLRQDDSEASTSPEAFTSHIDAVTVEQAGPVRAVVRIDGTHETDSGRQWLPFTARIYAYAGGDRLRMVHTFIFDGDESSDFLRGLGVRFEVPMRDELHNRHIRFAGEGRGLLAEAVRGITGLRRDPGEAVRKAQVAGEPTPAIETWDAAVRDRVQYIPAWGDFTLTQLSADGFQIRKRTKPGHGWVSAGAGTRASGLAYLGGPTGGLAFGLRDFWQRHPTQLDIRGAADDTAEATLWLYSPEAPPMDLRFYHDGMGMNAFPEQLEGLNITYEDYEPGFGTPHGIARTSELILWATDRTPAADALADFAEIVRTPPQLACTPEHLHQSGVFGRIWNLPDRSTAAKTKIEDQLEWYIDFYRGQVEQRRWYGFWDYGDVMHSYDRDRHVWRYDVGGYAWDNSELSPDLMLWYAFLRSGRAETFRLAEAMTRHTGEVDVYHLGRFKGLGTRHNVQHWGCSAKQLRISTAIYRRFFYFLTADERTGDLMRELVNSDETFLQLDPIRKIRKEAYEPKPEALAVGFGTDYSALAAAWFTEWERTGDAKCHEKLLNGMKTIGDMPLGIFTTGATYDLATGRFTASAEPGVSTSHLASVFGQVEIFAELIENFDVPEFERAWLQYCELYSMDRKERAAILGHDFRSGGLTSAHARLTAYVAAKKGDAALAERAWHEFFSDDRGWAPQRYTLETKRIEGPAALNPVDEAAWVSTNDAAQWGLAAIQCLALVGERLPADDPRTQPQPPSTET